MFAFVSNEYSGIVYSKQHLKLLSSVYSFPISQYFKTEEECWEYIGRHPRVVYDGEYTKRAGWIQTTSYIRIEYYIENNTIYVNMYTDHFGYVRLNIKDSNILQSPTYDAIKLKIMNISLDNESITSHCIAIQYIVQLLSPIVNVQFMIPDVSVYLALTAYTGRNAAIKRAAAVLSNRIGKVALILR